MTAPEIVSFEPATGAELWRCPVGDVDREVEAARRGWADWAARPLAFRIETLRRFANVVRGRGEAFADLVARETGKPLWEAREEIEAVIARGDLAAAAHHDRAGQRRLEGEMGARNALRHKPHGVLGVITPFSQPAALANDHIAPALIAGNAVVFKPSERTPASGALLVECYHEAGVPDAVVRLLIGGVAEGQALARHDGIDGLLYTGSPRNGLALNRQFAERPDKMLALRLGGNNPIVVWDPTDLDAAAAVIVRSTLLTTGQRCTAARRLIVEDGTQDALLKRIGKLVDRLIIGDPHGKPEPFIGPVIDNEAADALQEAYLSLMMKGGQPVRRMDRPVDGLPFLTPGIIDVTAIAERADEELFGPLLQLVRVPDFESALTEANRTRFGLSAALIGGSPALYERFWAGSRAAIVNWNQATIDVAPKAPLGGIGFSGNHRPGAGHAPDFCAWPVASFEADQARSRIDIGLSDS